VLAIVFAAAALQQPIKHFARTGGLAGGFGVDRPRRVEVTGRGGLEFVARRVVKLLVEPLAEQILVLEIGGSGNRRAARQRYRSLLRQSGQFARCTGGTTTFYDSGGNVTGRAIGPTPTFPGGGSK